MRRNPTFKDIRGKLAESCRTQRSKSHLHSYQTYLRGNTRRVLADTPSLNISFLFFLSSIKNTFWVHHSSPIKNDFAPIPMVFVFGRVCFSDLFNVDCIGPVFQLSQHSAQRWVSWNEALDCNDGLIFASEALFLEQISTMKIKASNCEVALIWTRL